MCVDLGQLRLTAWMLMVSVQVRYLKVIHGWRRTLGGATPVPLVQSVPGLGAQHPGCLLLLKVLDEGHSSISTGQIIPTCRITETAVAMCGEKGLITTAMGVSLFTVTSVPPPSYKNDSAASASHDQTFKFTLKARNRTYPLPATKMDPTAPSCTQPPYPAEERHTEPRRTSAWAGSHRHHTSCLEGSKTRDTGRCDAQRMRPMLPYLLS